MVLEKYFQCLLSGFLHPPGQLQPFPSWMSWRERNVRGEMPSPPASLEEMKRKGRLFFFCGKSAAAHTGSPHSWTCSWSMTDTVFLEVRGQGKALVISGSLSKTLRPTMGGIQSPWQNSPFQARHRSGGAKG